MDGGRSAGGSPQGPRPPGVPRRSWTQDQERCGGPGWPAGAQATFPLCTVPAAGQLGDPAQAGGAGAWEAPRLGRGREAELLWGSHLVPGLSVCLSVHQHMSSRRHKDRLAGKPPKPPKPPNLHSKLQKQAALAVNVLKVSAAWGHSSSGTGWARSGVCWPWEFPGR